MKTQRLQPPRSRRYLSLIVSGCLIAMVAWLATAQSRGYAAGGGDGCNPNRSVGTEGSQWDGWVNTQSSVVGGAYANIYNYSPWVSTGTPSGQYETVSAWSAVAQDTGNFAQVGWWEFAGSHSSPQRYTFVQIDVNGVAYQWTASAQTQDISTYYTTLFSPYSGGGGGTLSFQVAGSNVGGISSSYTNV